MRLIIKNLLKRGVTMSKSPLLKIDDLKITFGSKMKKIAVEELNLTIFKGETVALIGESGSGKSITSLSITGLLPNSSHLENGTISFKERNLLNLTEKEMKKVRGKEISMIFQDAIASLNPAMKIGVQITEGLKYHRLTSKANLSWTAVKFKPLELNTRLVNVNFHFNG
jgi:ABC-type microcin C transport system duplicated ATPase subunit YejF